MNCCEAEEQMALYVMNDLPEPELAHIRSHLDTCIKCRAWHQEVQEMLGIWNEAQPVMGLDLVSSVLDQIDANDTPRVETPIPRRVFTLKPLLRNTLVHYGVAASITIALFQFGVFQQLCFGLAQHGLLVSKQVHGLMHMLSIL